MKPFNPIIILVLVFLTSMASAQAQSPREQLNQMVEQLQKTPTDNALREKIIKQAGEIKPAPAIPQEARRAFVMGGIYQKEAKSAEDFALAVKAFQDATAAAPWWGDAYYNLSVALEAAKRFDEAKSALTLYLLTQPKDAEQAQERLYAIDAKKVLAAKQQAAAKVESGFARLAGTWLGVDAKSDPRDWQKLRASTRYPEVRFHRYRFLMQSDDKVLFYMDQHGGKWNHAPEGFWTTIYTGTRTNDNWQWQMKVADPRCGENQVVRSVPLEILEQGNIIRTKDYSVYKPDEQTNHSSMDSYYRGAGMVTTPGPAGCVVLESPIMFVRVSD